MSKAAKKLGIVILVTVWFILIMMPTFAIFLASRQQIDVDIGNTKLRIFLLQQANAEGLGIESTHPSKVNANCQQTSVRYLMWVGESENVIFCHCQDPQTNSSIPAFNGSCLPP